MRASLRTHEYQNGAPRSRAVALLTLALAAAGCEPAPTPAYRVLVFSRTAAFRHGAIPDATRAIEEIGAEAGFAVESTEDPGAFEAKNLARFRAVVFLLTSGDVIDPAQQSAFERYIRGGGGFAGVHSATDTEYDWPFYGGLVGAYFKAHPAIQAATVVVADRAHPSTAHLPPRWTRTDEWYAFRTNPREKVRVLATLDESTYAPAAAAMGADHPIAWCHDYEGGRAWYTALGHTRESYADPDFRKHLRGGIEWAAGQHAGAAR